MFLCPPVCARAYIDWRRLIVRELLNNSVAVGVAVGVAFGVAVGCERIVKHGDGDQLFQN